MPTVMSKISSSLLTENNKDQLLDKYQCPKCNYILRDAVQTSCGHWLCAPCAQELFKLKDGSTPICPRPECGEELTNEDGHLFFPDRFVRKEIGRFNVMCVNRKYGCQWTGTITELLDTHLKVCVHMKTECPHCKEAFTPAEYETHRTSCAKAPVQCPLRDYGCGMKEEMTRDQCVEHLTTKEGLYQHMQFLASFLSVNFPNNNGTNGGNVEEDGSMVVKDGAGGGGELALRVVQPDGPPSPSFNASTRDLPQKALVPLMSDLALHSGLNPSTEYRDLRQSISTVMTKFTELQSQLSQKDSIIHMLQDKVKQLEVNQQSKSSENEDRDFRLSLMENSNFDGSMVWKIPQFSQRMDDARTGKYTSIFSLPFYSSRYGYKMCLRLYILGDGIGKGSHMSLFFVVMKGEFDNILQWPFTHKVTFKLINQCGGRDIIDIFQPDPLSSSFQKPKSDMNVASGCPRFVSLTELMNGGYIVDDTVFIKVKVDTSTMRHP